AAMSKRRVGLWLIGACGGVGSTVALGLEALRRGLVGPVGLTTALPLIDGLDLDGLKTFVVGGHDVRRSSFRQAVREMHGGANGWDRQLIEPCLPTLDEWTANVRPGTVLNAGTTISKLADLPESRRAETAQSAIDRIQADMRAFRDQHQLDQVVVINVASTEPPTPIGEVHASIDKLRGALESRQPVLPASALYAWATLDL